jgi:hypothetical protein
MMFTNESCIHQGMKSELNSGNDCYRSVQNRLSSGCLSTNLEFETQKTKTSSSMGI